MKSKDLHSKIEFTLNSLDGIKRAQANPYLYTRVMERLKYPAPGILKPMLVWQAAASMVIILGLNIAIGFYLFNNNNKVNQSTESGYFINHIYNY